MKTEIENYAAEKSPIDIFGIAPTRIFDVVKKTSKFIRENPTLSVVAVLAAGLIVARIVSSKKSSPEILH